MKVLDLFSGLGGWSRAFVVRGHEIVTVDIEPRFKPTIIKDVMDMTADDMRGYDIVLASPPCNCFSVASIYRHWTGGKKAYIPKTKEAERAIVLVNHLFEILAGTRYIVENPRGMMRHVGPRKPDTTIWYCQYGDNRAKPTDIWTSIKELKWRPPCRNNNPNCHHDRAPRGTKRGGTQDMNRSPAQRALIPYGLSLDICIQIEAIFNNQTERYR